MSQEFEHIVILLGFIFGLALTHLLTSVNDLIHARCRVRFSWLHALSMVLALVFFIINWLALWDMRRVPHWRVVDVLSLLLSTANQYFVCSLVAMRVPEQGRGALVGAEPGHSTDVSVDAGCDLPEASMAYDGGGFAPDSRFLGLHRLIYPPGLRA
jgi:hypothetical protein